MFKRIAVSVSFVALSVLPVTAQVIHGHPQKSAYASPAEWVDLSAQCHWMVDGVLAHTHAEMKAPIYIEVHPGDKITVPVTFKLFHTSGKIVSVFTENGGIVLDTFGVWKEYVNVQGDAAGVSTWTGHVTFDTTRNNSDNSTPNAYRWSPHGWTEVRIVARTVFPNGTFTDTALEIPFYSMLHPEVPEIPYPEGRLHPVRSSCTPSPEGPFGWGLMVTEFKDFIPLGVLADGETTNPSFATYSYGVSAPLSGTPPSSIGTVDRRLDPDLHNGISGLQLTGPNTFDANVSGGGLHKFSFIWDVKGPSDVAGIRPGGEAAAILVVNVAVGGTAPPPTCQDHAATNFGGPLPCTYPVPPPPPCAGLVGQSANVTIGSVPFKVTVTSDTCSATVATF